MTIVDTMRSCYVCSAASVTRLRYRDLMGSVVVETRCEICAIEVKRNDANTLLDETVLDNSYNPDAWKQGATDETDAEDGDVRPAVRDISDGAADGYD